ncbi:hypothetical protein [Amycolatopsis echigonensis]|uniref:Secreted protein n=1 Tax=Amycolatopsis echigonensis TaxID=2576905 RepID=A0A8E2B297_9PSEU|nr:hypothetical protein [Amycolatopsis echigonensis]MBB2500429.1 hypothetical protein [Amycolatopsis echigonensis]
MKRAVTALALTLGSAAAGLLLAQSPASAANVNGVPLQICGSSAPIGTIGGSASSGRCANADGGNPNISAAPVQVCGYSVPVVGGPASARECDNGGEPGRPGTSLLPVQVCGATAAIGSTRIPVPSGPVGSPRCYNAPSALQTLAP